MEKLKGESLLIAAQSRLKAEYHSANANLEAYLHNPTGIGEHRDLVEEVYQLVKQAAEAKDAYEMVAHIADLYGVEVD